MKTGGRSSFSVSIDRKLVVGVPPSGASSMLAFHCTKITGFMPVLIFEWSRSNTRVVFGLN